MLSKIKSENQYPNCLSFSFVSTTIFLAHTIALIGNAGAQLQNQVGEIDLLNPDLNLDKWDPPDFMKKRFPYYLAGYDYEDRPVWVIEYGKYDFRGHFQNGGEETIRLYNKYLNQEFYQILNSPKLRPKHQQSNNTDNNGGDGDHHDVQVQVGDHAHEFAILADLEQFDLRQLSSTQTIIQSLKLASILNKYGENLAYLIIVNANYFGQSFLSIVQPALGGVFARMEIYGTNKEKWFPKLLKKVPKDNLPEWYGGYKNYTPIAVFG